jgi:hypothetical protein
VRNSSKVYRRISGRASGSECRADLFGHDQRGEGGFGSNFAVKVIARGQAENPNMYESENEVIVPVSMQMNCRWQRWALFWCEDGHLDKNK